MSAHTERRRATRALADFPIQLSPDEGAAEARLKDLSTIGLCCTTAQSVPELSKVAIALQLPDTTDQHRIIGAVVRCDAAQDDGAGYEVAVYFTEVGADTKAALQAYVAQGVPA